MDFLNASPMFVSAVAVLLAAAVLLLWHGGRRRRRLVRHLTGQVMAARLTVSLDPSRRRIRQGLLIAALLLMGVAAARPWWGYRLEDAPARSRDVLVAVDCSRSMLAEDVSPSRLEHAKWWIREVVTACPGDRFGLIAFAGTAFLECPLTQDRNTLFQFLADLDTATLPVGGTNVQEALATAREAFEGAEGPYRAVLLISDGGEQQGEALAELDRFRKAQIPLFVAGVGDPTQMTPIRTEDGKYLRDGNGDVVETTLHEPMLRDLATSTAGLYVRSTAVKPNTEPVVKRIRELVPQRREGTQTRRPRERYQFPLAAAVLLLLVRMTLGERRPPNRVATAVCLLLLTGMPTAPAQQGEESGDVPEDPRRAFNAGVRRHRDKEYDRAESLYLHALDAADDNAEIASRAAQNLGALKQQRADAVLTQTPEQALEILERAEAYNVEALRLDSENEGAARNQERLLRQRRRAEELLEQARRDRDRQTDESPEDDPQQADGEPRKPPEDASGEQTQGAEPQGGDQGETPRNGEETQGKSEAEAQAQAELGEDIEEDVARALLRQMLEEEKELREAVKEYRARNRKLGPVEKDW